MSKFQDWSRDYICLHLILLQCDRINKAWCYCKSYKKLQQSHTADLHEISDNYIITSKPCQNSASLFGAGFDDEHVLDTHMH